jgi:hypothetical protein
VYWEFYTLKQNCGNGNLTIKFLAYRLRKKHWRIDGSHIMKDWNYENGRKAN